MKYQRRRITAGMTAIVITAWALSAGPAAATPHRGHAVEHVATFGSGLGSGSTIGPDGALYVTDGNAGAVLRINTRTGSVSTVASGLPKRALDIGGAIDVAFLHGRMYVLVTMVGGELLVPGGPIPIGNDQTVGIYRLERNGSFTVVADIGAFSEAHPPAGDFFITTGVQYALDTYRGGFLVSDGHHNRVLSVSLDGQVSEAVTFGDIVPTGLETWGNRVFLAEAGPVPHRPADAKIVALHLTSHTSTEVASGVGDHGAGLTVDVERGSAHHLYALLQGVWDLPNEPQNAGAPASPDTGELVRVDNGTFTTIAGGLDRPTSMEIVGRTGYVITLDGEVLRVAL